VEYLPKINRILLTTAITDGNIGIIKKKKVTRLGIEPIGYILKVHGIVIT